MTLRNEPIQSRAQTRLESITQAATELVAELGREYVNTALIAERAGCSIGTVYRYFDDIHAILDVVQPIDRHGVTRVLELHRRIAVDDDGDELQICDYDGILWPCPTIQLLVDGERR